MLLFCLKDIFKKDNQEFLTPISSILKGIRFYNYRNIYLLFKKNLK